MIRWQRGRVASLEMAWEGVQTLQVRLDDASTSPALSYVELCGYLSVGDEVLLNTTALDRGLGTGGFAFVVGPGNRVPPAAEQKNQPGHLVKARYTPTQAMVLGVDEQESAFHDLLKDADSIAGMPVVVADLHSALPAVIAGARFAAEGSGCSTPRIVYIMTDGGALPVWFSRTVAGLKSAGWIDAVITCGQAFGGDLEAVSLHSALLAAHLVAKADVVVVAQGPGNLGTGTRWGFSGVNAGEAVNAIATLGGSPIASLRLSNGDARDRHLGVSHHSLTAYGRVALAAADVVVPKFSDDVGCAWNIPPELRARIDSQSAELAGTAPRHTFVDVDVTGEVMTALSQTPVKLSTMGRSLRQDATSFAGAAAAGIHAWDVYQR